MHIQTGTTTVTMVHPPLPASPTLTNPDMILPYGEYDSTPLPPQQSYSSHPSGAWKGSGQTENDFSIGPPRVPVGPMTPTTPIIYGNGTMLSDIGEVTEAESVSAKRLPGPAERRALKQQQTQGSPLRSSSVLGYDAVMKRTKRGTHERKVSVESTSTITSESQAAELFQDMDDGVSVDSNFQGDHEQSVADSYSEGVIASETQRLAGAVSSTGQDEDKHSSAALSRRAEQILLSAKRRLNTMEGNLTRARSILYTIPTGSMSSIHSSSPLSRSSPSPPQNVGLASKFRQYSSAEALNGKQGHSRNYSDNSISSAIEPASFPAHSASAAATYTTGKNGVSGSPPDGRFSSRPVVTSPFGKASTTPQPVVLEPLSEDEAPDFAKEREDLRSSIENTHLQLFVEHRGLTRSASSMQMRDLRDQMQDLKGRLSVLRDRARDDTMKRRSLQSLRTPSPFTVAEPWLSTTSDYKEDQLKKESDVSVQPVADDISGESEKTFGEDSEGLQKQASEDATSDVLSVYEDVSEIPLDEHRHEPAIPEEEEDFETASREDESFPNDEPENDYNEEAINTEEADYESDASLYHDSVVSHEDREDAFDYEHFFLHSAMGTINQQRLARRDSTGSFSSEDSVETTRGPTISNRSSSNNESRRPSVGLSRSDSTASVSTVATFETADEERESENREDDHGNYAVQHVYAPERSRSRSPETAKRSTFGPMVTDNLQNGDQASTRQGSRPKSAVRISPEGLHRPSIASFQSTDSVGTTRSFPLVNKAKSQSFTPAGTPHPENQRNSEGMTGQNGGPVERLQPSPVQMLARDDRILVEKLVASVGKCVLGLQEAGSSGYEGRIWRRRLDAARRVLEGEEGAV